MKYGEFEKMNEQVTTHCWYVARRELLKHELRKVSPPFLDLKILDIASACGDSFIVCSDYGKTFGIDISWDAIGYCKQKNIGTILQGDAHNLPFKSNSFDIVIALDVFEHLEDDIMSMKEMERVLKKGGKLIFNVPAFMFLFSYHDLAFHHFRRYKAEELKYKLEQAKFQINYLTYWSFFILPAIFVMRKFFNFRKKHYRKALSDFHLKVPFSVQKILKFLNFMEFIFIKKGISLPFGVSLYGVARKK